MGPVSSPRLYLLKHLLFILLRITKRLGFVWCRSCKQAFLTILYKYWSRVMEQNILFLNYYLDRSFCFSNENMQLLFPCCTFSWYKKMDHIDRQSQNLEDFLKKSGNAKRLFNNYHKTCGGMCCDNSFFHESVLERYFFTVKKKANECNKKGTGKQEQHTTCHILLILLL